MELLLTCRYCNHQWGAWLGFDRLTRRCPVCKDSNIKTQKNDKTKVNYYEQPILQADNNKEDDYYD